MAAFRGLEMEPFFSPSNLALGICLTAFFSCWFLVGAFEALRKLKGVGDWPALVD